MDFLGYAQNAYQLVDAIIEVYQGVQKNKEKCKSLFRTVQSVKEVLNSRSNHQSFLIFEVPGAIEKINAQSYKLEIIGYLEDELKEAYELLRTMELRIFCFKSFSGQTSVNVSQIVKPEKRTFGRNSTR